MDDFFAAMRLSALLDGELEGEEKIRVEQAIRDRPRLRVQYSRMMTAVELVRSQGNMTAPDILEQKILDRLRADGMMGTTWVDRAPSRRTVTAVAAALLAIVLIWAQWPKPLPVSDELLPEETKVVAKAPQEEKIKRPSPAPAIDVRRPSERRKTLTPTSPPPRPKATTREKSTAPPLVHPEVPLWEDEFLEPPTDFLEPLEIEPESTTIRLYPNKPDALYVLDGWVAHTGGSMNAGSRGLRVCSNEDNYAFARILIPGTALSTLLDQLQGLGPLHQAVPPPPDAATQDNVTLEIELQYQP